MMNLRHSTIGTHHLDSLSCEVFWQTLDSYLKAMLAFYSTEQRASGGTSVRVRVLLSRPLPVAVRVPYSVGGSATADDYKDLSPSPSDGLLFLAGETSKEIVVSLLENKSSQAKTVTLTLGELSEIGLLRSDGTGPEAPYLEAKTFLITHKFQPQLTGDRATEESAQRHERVEEPNQRVGSGG